MTTLSIEPAIEIRNLTKEYRKRSRGQSFSLMGGWKSRREILKALNGINLTIHRGEMLGIIGMNGSGKSTLLKHIAGISTPTQGQIKVNGRVGSLIELGAGFHPELSGYENVFLNAIILGMDRSTVENLLPKIIEFAGLEKFMDMPIKHYSSGMQMRLGFSIAIQMQPDILLLDETMAVGDVEFQSRAVEAIQRMHLSGATILMVNHDVLSIQEYCQRILWLHEGKVKMVGESHEVVAAYRDFLGEMAGTEGQRLLALHGNELYSEPLHPSKILEIVQLDVLDDQKKSTHRLEHPKRITLVIHYKCREVIERARVCVAMIRKENQAVVIEKDSERDGVFLGPFIGKGKINFSFECEDLLTDSFMFIAAIYPPDDLVRPWSRATTDFDLIGLPQPTPDAVAYTQVLCRTFEHKVNSYL